MSDLVRNTKDWSSHVTAHMCVVCCHSLLNNNQMRYLCGESVKTIDGEFIIKSDSSVYLGNPTAKSKENVLD